MTENPINSEIEELERELKTAAWQLLATFACVFSVAFWLGYISGIN